MDYTVHGVTSWTRLSNFHFTTEIGINIDEVFMSVYVLSGFSRVQLFATPWTTAYQAPQAIEFFRQKCWGGLSCPPPRDLPDSGMVLASPALQVDFLQLSLQACLCG